MRVLTVYMCRPTYFSVPYEINPWMNRRVQPDHRLALRQWNRIVRTLRRLGVKVVQIPPARNLADMCFAANAGTLRPEAGAFLPSRFRWPQRRREERHWIRFFRRNHCEILDPPARPFEGEGDLLRVGDRLFAGYGFRTHWRSLGEVERRLNVELVALRLSDPRFYHLDTCFAPLDDRTALYYPPAFDAASRHRLKRFVRRLLPVETEDALRMACNCFAAGSNILMNPVSEKLRRRLAGLGFRILPCPTSEFIKSGASVKCLVLAGL